MNSNKLRNYELVADLCLRLVIFSFLFLSLITSFTVLFTLLTLPLFLFFPALAKSSILKSIFGFYFSSTVRSFNIYLKPSLCCVLLWHSQYMLAGYLTYVLNSTIIMLVDITGEKYY